MAAALPATTTRGLSAAPIFDSHRHVAAPTTLSLARCDEVLAFVVKKMGCVDDGKQLSGRRANAALFATSPLVDWQVLERIEEISCDPHSQCIRAVVPCVGFGVHPWFVGDVCARAPLPLPTESESCPGPTLCGCPEPKSDHGKLSTSTTSDWHTKLCCLLEKWPSAIVGEIGLDKTRMAEAVQWEQQLLIFQSQLAIAARYKRAVSVHCVRAFGPMLDIMSKTDESLLPPTIVFHGYSGSLDFARSLFKLPKKKGSRFYFGFGSATTLKLKQFDELAAVLPRNRILLESDSFELEQATERLTEIVIALSRVWDCSDYEVLSTTGANAADAYNLGCTE